jgi:hypothetical protein
VEAVAMVLAVLCAGCVAEVDDETPPVPACEARRFDPPSCAGEPQDCNGSPWNRWIAMCEGDAQDDDARERPDCRGDTVARCVSGRAAVCERVECPAL